MDAARSRTGYIILLAGCPLVWRSTLQTEVSLSTLESEYSALSLAIRQLLPVLRTVEECLKLTQIGRDLRITAPVPAIVFEDNNGALALATNQRVTSRTRYFITKWHFFWEHVNSGLIVIKKVETENQGADYLTKGLPKDSYERNRKLIQGW